MVSDNSYEQSEEVFHDNWAKEAINEELHVTSSFESSSCPENRQIVDWMGNLSGKSILELGSGLGEAAIYFASKGAIVTATDISEGMLEVVRLNAERRGLMINRIKVSSNHLNNIENDAFDYTYAANLLHHVNVEQCVSELKKKLKVGGTAFFWDPIAYNPAINVYRKIATKVRTVDEHPLTVRDFKLISKIFDGQVEFKFFWFTSLYVFLKFFFIDKVDPNKERYWKKILVDADTLEPLLARLHRVDGVLFRYVPFLKYLAWNVVIRAKRIH